MIPDFGYKSQDYGIVYLFSDVLSILGTDIHRIQQ